MQIKISKLAMITMPCLVALGLAACGGSSSGGGDNFDPTAASKFVTQGGGEPVTPSGVTVPTTDVAAEESGFVFVQYLDDNFAKNGERAEDAMKLSLHLWDDDDGCVAKTITNSNWDDKSLIPSYVDEYGPVWKLALDEGSTFEDDGCMGVIIRDTDGNTKLGTGKDMKLVWSGTDHSQTLSNKKDSSYSSRIEAFNEKYSQSASFEVEDASAHFLSEKVLAWKNVGNKTKHVRLQYDVEGVVGAKDDALTGKFINLTEISLPSELLENHQNLSDFKGYEIPADAEIDLKAALKGEMILIGLDGNNNVVAQSKIQTASLIDALYAEKVSKINDLGATVTAEGITFKVWAPTAQKVTLHLWPKAGVDAWDDVGGEMKYDQETGIWSYTSNDADAQGNSAYKYQVSVYHPSTRKIESLWVTDPYSLSVVGENSYIVDLNSDLAKPTGWDDLKSPRSQSTNKDIAGMFITESHIRDLTVGEDKGISTNLQGKYLGVVESNTNLSNHLKALGEAGVTHIELLPLYDIASIDEGNVFDEKTLDVNLTGSEFCSRAEVTKTESIDVCGSSDTVYNILAEVAADENKSAQDVKDVDKLSNKVDKFLNQYVKGNDSYNWGYDPWHYQAPEVSYATKRDAYTPIRELREMIMGIKNDYKMNTILDVVYNHTDGSGTQKPSSVLDRLVPWYYNRLNAETGKVINDTCCEDTATEHKMMAKLMEDTLVTWAKEYKFDAFRFDLMGYIPKQVMIDTLANVKERSGNEEMYFFGEGWNAGSSAAVVGSANNSTQINLHGSGIGTFNDRIRDGVRGSGPFDHGDSILRGQGFATGRCTDINAQRKEDEPTYNCDPKAVNETDGGMHALHWQDIIRISMAGNLRDYQILTYTDEVKTGKELSYGDQSAGYGDNPIETINYVSKHDNQAIFDMIMYKAEKSNTMLNKAKMQGIALATVILGQSPAFDQQGSDLLRTKFFQNDSYNTGDFSNAVNYSMSEGNGFIPKALVNKEKDKDDWAAIIKVGEYNKDVGAEVKAKMVNTYLALAKIRSEHPLLHLGDAELIKQHVSFPDVGSEQKPGVIIMNVTKPASFDTEDQQITVYLNAGPKPNSFDYDELNVQGAQALDTGALFADSCSIKGNKVELAPWSVCVFVK